MQVTIDIKLKYVSLRHKS